MAVQTQIQFRRGPSSSWTGSIVLAAGELGLETDTGRYKIGNGSAIWSSLPYYVSSASPSFTGTPLAPTAISGTNTTQIATTEFANTAGGLVFINNFTATTQSTLSVPNVFSSTYQNYRMVISNITTNTDNGLMQFTFISGVGSYSYGFSGFTYAGAADSLSLNAGAFASICRTDSSVGGFSGSCVVDIMRPNVAAATTYTSTGTAKLGSLTGGGVNPSATSYTGLTLGLFNASSFSCNVRVYGYK